MQPAPEPRAAGVGSAIALVAVAAAAVGLALCVARELRRWPGTFDRGQDIDQVVGAAAVAAVAGLVAAMVIERLLRRRALGAALRWSIVSALFAPLCLALGLAICLGRPVTGITRMTLTAIAVAGLFAIWWVMRWLRGGAPRSSLWRRTRAPLVAVVLVSEVMVALAIVRHEPRHRFEHRPGEVVRFDALRPANKGELERPWMIGRLLPAGVRLELEPVAAAGAYLRIQLSLPRAAHGPVELEIGEVGSAPFARVAVGGDGRSEQTVVRLPETMRPLQLGFERGAPFIIVRELHVGPRAFLQASEILGAADPARAFDISEARAAVWRKVRAGHDARNAIVMPVPASVCVELSARPRGRLAVAIVDGLSNGECRVAVRALDGAGESVGSWSGPLDQDGWREIPLDLPLEVREICIAAEADLDLGWSIAWAEPLLDGAEARRPNVVLISIDTLRADVLGLYGHRPSVTPELDRLATSGLLFESATAASSWTLPSHVSLLTGLYPSRHGVWGSSLPDVAGRRLPASAVTLAERLRSEGFHTLASTGGGFVSAVWGFARGFDRYVEVPRSVGGKDLEQVMSAVEELLASARQPFFLFVHTYSVHHPYGGETPPDPSSYAADRELAWRRYLDGVAYVDASLAHLADMLAEHGPTTIVVTSDHGEEFGDHDPDMFIQGHGHSVYEEVVHVPLIVAGAGVPAGVRVAAPVGLCDVAPTILDLAQAPPLTAIDGQSLVPYLLEPGTFDDRVILAERAFGDVEPKAARLGSIKLIREVAADAPARFFDLAVDPREASPLATVDAAARLERALGGLVAEPPSLAPGQEIDPQLLEQLEALGYLR